MNDETKRLIDAVDGALRVKHEEIAELHDEIARLNRIITNLMAAESEGIEMFMEVLSLMSRQAKDKDINP